MKSFYLENQDAFIRYLETPSTGPTLVYLPAISFSAAASFFEVVTHPKTPGHRALLVDYLGSGASDHPEGFGYSIEEHASSIAALMDAAGCRGATVFGHSMGGTVAIQLAITASGSKRLQTPSGGRSNPSSRRNSFTAIALPDSP